MVFVVLWFSDFPIKLSVKTEGKNRVFDFNTSAITPHREIVQRAIASSRRGGGLDLPRVLAGRGLANLHGEREVLLADELLGGRSAGEQCLEVHYSRRRSRTQRYAPATRAQTDRRRISAVRAR